MDGHLGTVIPSISASGVQIVLLNVAVTDQVTDAGVIVNKINQEMDYFYS